MNPSSFTFELLNSLKFKELQKLSIQFNVNKRWAKKQELIENLLSLKTGGENIKEEEWLNGSLVFSKNKENFTNENDEDKSTTSINNKNESENVIDRRLTFVISPKDDNVSAMNEQINERGVDNFKADKDTIPDSRATFEIPPNLKKFGKNKVKSTLGKEKQTEKKTVLLKNSHKQLNNKSENLKKTNSAKLVTPTTTFKGSSRKGELSKDCFYKLTKSSTLRKLHTSEQRSKQLNSLKSPFLLKDSMRNKNMLEEHSKRMTQSEKPLVSKIPKKCSPDNINTIKKDLKPHKENVFFNTPEKKNLNDKKSDQVNSIFSSAQQKINTKVFVPKTPLNRTLAAGKNGVNSNLQPQKNCLTAKKMPDFKKIHQKQFEKMDSVVDYLKKKEERSKKLIGAFEFKGQKSIQSLNKSIDINSPRNIGRTENPKLVQNKKSAFARAVQKENIKSKLPVLNQRTENIRDKNRRLIQGVRMNKRFELQMKFRNV